MLSLDVKVAATENIFSLIWRASLIADAFEICVHSSQYVYFVCASVCFASFCLALLLWPLGCFVFFFIFEIG